MRSSRIVILTAVSSLLMACVITSPVIFTSAETKNMDPSIEASILAERHLDRAMEEMQSTGRCPAEGRTVSCDDGRGSVYELRTSVVRSESGEARRVSVRVRWKGPLGGGAIVATGICGGGQTRRDETLSAGSFDEGLAGR